MTTFWLVHEPGDDWHTSVSRRFIEWLGLSSQQQSGRFIALLDATRQKGISRHPVDRLFSLEHAARLRRRNMEVVTRNVCRRHSDDGLACWIVQGAVGDGRIRQTRYIDRDLSKTNRTLIETLADESWRLDIGQDRAAALQCNKAGQLISLNHEMASLVEEGIVNISEKDDTVTILGYPISSHLSEITPSRHRAIITVTGRRSIFLRIAWQWDHRNLTALYAMRIIDLSARPPIPMEAWPSSINPANRQTAAILSWGDLSYHDIGMIRDHLDRTSRTRQATITSIRQVLSTLGVASYEEFQSKLRKGRLFG